MQNRVLIVVYDLNMYKNISHVTHQHHVRLAVCTEYLEYRTYCIAMMSRKARYEFTYANNLMCIHVGPEYGKTVVKSCRSVRRDTYLTNDFCGLQFHSI